MKKKYFSKAPDFMYPFYAEHELVLTNDLDSLLSCYYMTKNCGYKITGFYDFNHLFTSDQTEDNDLIFVDCDLMKGKCVGNHVTKLYKEDMVNPECFNINNFDGIHRGNYTDKYCGSSLLQIMSFYREPLPKSDEEKMILLAIDGTYLGYYNQYFRKRHSYYIGEVLGYPELIEVEKRYSKQKFDEIKYKYNLDALITVNKHGNLETKIDLASLSRVFNFALFLPQVTFTLKNKFRQSKVKLPNNSKPLNSYSGALIYKNTFKCSIKEVH